MSIFALKIRKHIFFLVKLESLSNFKSHKICFGTLNAQVLVQPGSSSGPDLISNPRPPGSSGVGGRHAATSAKLLLFGQFILFTDSNPGRIYLIYLCSYSVHSKKAPAKLLDFTAIKIKLLSSETPSYALKLSSFNACGFLVSAEFTFQFSVILSLGSTFKRFVDASFVKSKSQRDLLKICFCWFCFLTDCVRTVSDVF